MTRVHQPNTLCWIDLGTPDPDAAAAFYQTVFGWTIDAPDATGYRLCRLGGLLVGALGPSDDPGTPYWTTYVSVSDAERTVASVVAAGGEVVSAPAAVEHVGTFAILTDSMKTPFSVWQPEGLTGVETGHGAGAWVASHLVTDGPDESRSFYQSVFGWAEHNGVFRLGSFPVASVGPPGTTFAHASNWLTIFATDDLTTSLRIVNATGGREIGTTRIDAATVTIVEDNQATPFGLTTAATNPSCAVG